MNQSNKYYSLYPYNTNRDPEAAAKIPEILAAVEKEDLDNDDIKQLYAMLYLSVRYPKDENDAYFRSLKQLFYEVQTQYNKIRDADNQIRAEKSQMHLKNITTPELLEAAKKKLNEEYESCSKIIEKRDISNFSRIFELYNILYYSTWGYPIIEPDMPKSFASALLEFKSKQFEMRSTVGEWNAIAKEINNRNELNDMKALAAKQGGGYRAKSKGRRVKSKGHRAKSKGRRSKSRGRPGRKK